jgi:hypothetical protein
MFLSIENHKKSPNYQGFRGFFIFIFFTFLAKLLFQLLVGGGVNSNFKGHIRPILFTAGMHSFLKYRGVLNKNYKEWVMKKSSVIVDDASKYSKEFCGNNIIYIPSLNIRKEELAHTQQKKLGIKNGLIGIWSCVESCNTFKSKYDATAGYPQLHSVSSRCKHLYFYFDHSDYGFMSIRLQTWAPYNIQIALNGREWLRRLLDKEGCGYIISGNKFLHINDYELAQHLLDSQTDTQWEKMLMEFLPVVFPSMSQILAVVSHLRVLKSLESLVI